MEHEALASMKRILWKDFHIDEQYFHQYKSLSYIYTPFSERRNFMLKPHNILHFMFALDRSFCDDVQGYFVHWHFPFLFFCFSSPHTFLLFSSFLFHFAFPTTTFELQLLDTVSVGETRNIVSYTDLLTEFHWKYGALDCKWKLNDGFGAAGEIFQKKRFSFVNYFQHSIMFKKKVESSFLIIVSSLSSFERKYWSHSLFTWKKLIFEDQENWS